MRVFLDTNVLVSAFASRGICGDLLEVVLLEHDLVVGENVLRELRKALRTKLKLSAPRCTEIVEFVAEEAVLVVENAKAAVAPVDADDALVLGEAGIGLADVFVTGDRALLEVRAVCSITIVSPRRFWELLGGGQEP